MRETVQNISYIIGFRESNPERKKALLYVLNMLRTYFPDMEILIVEQDEYPRFELAEQPTIRKVFIKNKGLYNRCWAFNIGVKHTEKNIFAFADADIFLEKKGYEACFLAMQEFETVTPNMTQAFNVKTTDLQNLVSFLLKFLF